MIKISSDPYLIEGRFTSRDGHDLEIVYSDTYYWQGYMVDDMAYAVMCDGYMIGAFCEEYAYGDFISEVKNFVARCKLNGIEDSDTIKMLGVDNLVEACDMWGYATEPVFRW